MFDCVILGDSIAVGVASAIASIGIGCEVRAGVGWPTQRISRQAISSSHQVAIISAGSNDTAGQRLGQQLRMLRTKVNADCVIWIYPYTADRAWQVQTVAYSFGDTGVSFVKNGSKDGVHPRSYALLARALSRSMDCIGPVPLTAAAYRQSHPWSMGLKRAITAR